MENNPFETYAKEYDGWFDEYREIYLSELLCVRSMLPDSRLGLEIGAGSGRFAYTLEVPYGLEPVRSMYSIAQSRGIAMIAGDAENLPIADSSLDYCLMVTAICFIPDVEEGYREALRVLRPGGRLINALVDRNSDIGKSYEQHKNEDPFYKNATFYSVDEAIEGMEKAGFGGFRCMQTLTQGLGATGIETPEPGYGKGAFVAISAIKPF